jgi:hypothetical protein
MKNTTILLALAALLVSGCYAYEYAYYEPASATKTVSYAERSDITYVHYEEPSVVYVRYYDPWWYTPVYWSIWCDFCFCYHKHYYECPRYHTDYRYRSTYSPDRPRTYGRDTSGRQHYDRVSSAPRRTAPTRTAPTRTTPTAPRAPVHAPRMLR